ncbi:SRPBCC family protein [Streptomyces sp. NBC_00354]|uniref:SRPBCC family protein n=1 Tax=Streptomyces sp. NBC_00354 TaxID=2975723 RepID=UPI002E2726F7|nr:SRPBCC family protein [Streptomyces sp. NBC_01001]
MVSRTLLRTAVVPAAPAEAPSFPVTGYEATLSVHPHGEGSEVRWQGTYEAESADAVAQVEQLFGDGTYATGLAALRERFAR